jgi:nitroreductase
MKPHSGVSGAGAIPVRPSLSSAGFPYNGPASQQLEFLLKYAVLAPSGHNTQPWRFRISGSAVDIYGDFSRAMPLHDPDNRELVMSCGAALLNLRVAVRNFGLTAMSEICPDPDAPELLARLKLTGEALSGRTDHKLFKAIPDRRTARVPFESRPIPRALLYRWQRAAAYEEAAMHILESEEERRALAGMVAEGDRCLTASPEYRNELARWIRSNTALGRDGLPGYSVGLGDLSSRVAARTVFPFGGDLARRDTDLVRHAPAFVVLGTEEDTPEAWMIAGQALGRVLLAAQSEGVSASFFLQPIELPHLRQRLMDLLPGEVGFPQITFRLGYAQRVPPTPRRPLSDVVSVDSSAGTKETEAEDLLSLES